jgi:Transcriptional regulators
MSNIQKINLLQNFGIDGFILATGDSDETYLTTILDNGFPVVMVNRFTENKKIDCVINDDEDGIQKAFSHLWNLGHRKICMISGPPKISTSRIRGEAFKKLSKSCNKLVKSPQVYKTKGYLESEGFRVISELILSKKFDWTAVLCGNDRLAIGAIEALSVNGYNCPKDVSVVGFNDMPLVERLDPALTTISINSYGLGMKAADRLISRISMNEGLERKIDCLPVELKIRSSTAAPKS